MSETTSKQWLAEYIDGLPNLSGEEGPIAADDRRGGRASRVPDAER